MPTLQKFETITDWRWLHCEITDEQAKEYRNYENALKKGEDVEEPEWLWELDWGLVRDKPANDEIEYSLLPDEHDTHLRTHGTSGVL